MRRVRPRCRVLIGLAACLLFVLAETVRIGITSDLPVLNNDVLTLQFDSLFRVASLQSHLEGISHEIIGDPGPLWRLTFVSRIPEEKVVVTSDVLHCNRTFSAHTFGAGAGSTGSAVELSFDHCAIPEHEGDAVTVIVLAQLAAGSDVVEVTMPRITLDDGEFGFWSIELLLSGLGLPDNASLDALLLPVGLGLVVQNPAGAVLDFSETYPSQATMPFFAYYGPVRGTGAESVDSRGAYFAAHDPDGRTKQLLANRRRRTGSGASGGSGGLVVDLSIALVPDALAQRGSGQSVPFAFQVGVFAGDWYNASMLYRRWVLPAAAWTQAGPLRRRTDVPPWLLANDVWLNTGWQVHDVFDPHQGDPDVVVPRVQTLQKLLGVQQLALHWYVWDTTAFDTAYPDFFPAKPGFAAAAAQLQAGGVRVVPYINGRLFDMGNADWQSDGAAQWAAKAVTPLLDSKDLSLYKESYGSGATFAVMCPATGFWQQTIAAAAGALVANFSVDGVYIDQIAAARAVPCSDPAHGHTLGGGEHWRRGYACMLQQARRAAGPRPAALLTESNCEVFMDSVNGYLTADAFVYGALDGPLRVVPAFSAVYGGYYVAFVFFQIDLADGGAVFSAKLAGMFVMGVQLGWFSLGGTREPPAMGLFDALLDPANAPLLAYLRTLLAYRALLRSVFVHGRTLPPPPLLASSPSGAHRSRAAVPYPAVFAAAWGEAEGGPGTVYVVLTVSDADRDERVTGALDLRRCGYPEAARQRFVVRSVTPTGATVVAQGWGDAVPVDVCVGGRTVVLLTIDPL